MESANAPFFIDPANIKIHDLGDQRKHLPEREPVKMDMSKLMQLGKTIIGKDLARYSLPVFLNEPMTILQKTAEFMVFTEYFTKASKQTDPFLRMVDIMSFLAAC